MCNLEVSNCTNLEGSYACNCFNGYTGLFRRFQTLENFQASDIEIEILSKETKNLASMLTNALKISIVAMLKCRTVSIRMDHTLVSVCPALKVVFEMLRFHSILIESEPDKTSCSDIDECDDGTHTCSSGFKCVNNIGSYKCIDRDECVENSHSCNETTSKCENTDGSYNCPCLLGYVGIVLNLFLFK